ncbi:MAG TPA: hypothetical protein VJ961_02380 [Mariprofundaceae bacterium]|nr:hypothetical protein [Mariprofundaceae bacterium]
MTDKGRLTEQYDKLAHRFNGLYLEGSSRGRESMSEALEKARKQLTALGEFSTERGEELKQYLARDLDRTIAEARHLGDEAWGRFHPSRLGGWVRSPQSRAYWRQPAMRCTLWVTKPIER